MKDNKVSISDIEIEHDIDERFASLCKDDLNAVLVLMGRKDRVKKLIDSKYGDKQGGGIKIADKVGYSQLKGEILEMECESGKSLKKAVIKQNEYCLRIFEQFMDYKIKPIMFTIWPQRLARKKVQWGSLGHFSESLLYPFFDIDGDEQLKILSYKTYNKLTLNRFDIMFLLFAAYTDYSIEASEMLLKITKFLNRAIMNRKLKNSIRSYHTQDCKRLVKDKEKRKEIWEEMEMDYSVLDLARQSILDKVEEKKTMDIARNMKNDGCDWDKIVKYTGLSLDEISLI